jgi:hypothetical protein
VKLTTSKLQFDLQHVEPTIKTASIAITTNITTKHMGKCNSEMCELMDTLQSGNVHEPGATNRERRSKRASVKRTVQVIVRPLVVMMSPVLIFGSVYPNQSVFSD